MEEPDDQLVFNEATRVAAIDVKNAFEGFYHTEYPQLILYARYLGATRDEADESIHVVMVDMLSRWKSIRTPRSYARKAIRNQLYKHWEHQRRFPLFDDLPEQSHPTEESGWEETGTLIAALQKLPRVQREVMALKIDDFKAVEIAAILNKSPDAVRQNLRLAREKLKNLWPTNGPTPIAVTDTVGVRKEDLR